jgi:hypothetical protein
VKSPYSESSGTSWDHSSVSRSIAQCPRLSSSLTTLDFPTADIPVINVRAIDAS